MAYLYSKLHLKCKGYLSLYRKSIFKYKGTYLLQTDSKLAIIFLSFDMYFNGKRIEKNWGNLTIFNNCLMFSARPLRLTN